MKKIGELSFGIMWISLDGRLQARWFQTFDDVKEQYDWLKNLKIKSTVIVKIKDSDLK